MASSGSTTAILELQPQNPVVPGDDKTTPRSESSSRPSTQFDDGNATLPRPAAAGAVVSELQRWNKPRGNIGRLAAAFLGFFVCGMNDAAYGALIPYLESYYALSYTVISLVFLSPFVGYSLAALTNASFHSKFGQRGIVIAAPLCQIVTYLVICLHPPYPAVVIFGAISGFGTGLLDAAMSAWTGHMAQGNTIEGLLHAFYSGGATFSPLIATSMITQAHLPWYTFFYVMLGLACVELVICTVTFWSKSGHVYRMEHPRTSTAQGSRTKEALRNKVTWLCSIYLFTYCGTEIALGGWIVSFMLQVRRASPYKAGVSATGFWAGMTFGRAALGPLTERFGERLCVSIYLACTIALELVFWLVPQFLVSAIAVAFLGVFLGPIFPSGIIMATRLLPKHLHTTSIGFAIAIGGTGGAIFPFIVGAIAQSRGVAVLQPIVVALMVVLCIVWTLFPRIKKQNIG